MVQAIPAANECIYCGNTEDLSKEHIIPLSLGGKIVIPKASCASCRDLTSSIEHKISRQSFHLARAIYKLPTRRPLDYPQSREVTVRYGKYGPSRRVVVPLDRAPIDVIFPLYQLTTKDDQGVISSVEATGTAQIAAENNERIDHLIKQYAPGPLGGSVIWLSNMISVRHFSLFLWKITHCLLWIFDKDLARSAATLAYIKGNTKTLITAMGETLHARNIYSISNAPTQDALATAAVLTKADEGHAFLHFEIEFLRKAGLPVYYCVITNPTKTPIERRQLL